VYQNIYAEKHGRNVHMHKFIANKFHTNVERSFKVTKGNHRNVTKVLLMLIVYMFYHQNSASNGCKRTLWRKNSLGNYY